VDTRVKDVLEADHAEIDTLFEAACGAIQSADPATAYRATDLFWARLAVHIRAEHLRLFKEIRESAAADNCPADLSSALPLLDELRHDHDFFMRELARAIKALRLVFHFGNEAETFAVVSEILERVGKRLETHNVTEEQRLYPLASLEYMSRETLESLINSIKAELANIPHRYRGTSS